MKKKALTRNFYIQCKLSIELTKMKHINSRYYVFSILFYFSLLKVLESKEKKAILFSLLIHFVHSMPNQFSIQFFEKKRKRVCMYFKIRIKSKKKKKIRYDLKKNPFFPSYEYHSIPLPKLVNKIVRYKVPGYKD